MVNKIEPKVAVKLIHSSDCPISERQLKAFTQFHSTVNHRKLRSLLCNLLTMHLAVGNENLLQLMRQTPGKGCPAIDFHNAIRFLEQLE